MRLRSKVSVLVLPVVSALVLAGCGGGGGSSSGDGVISLLGNDPQNPLIPTNTQETEGGKIVDAMWSGLLKYNPDTGKAENEMATSITPSEKNTVFDIKFKKGWKFQDGTEVKADNFINAWNYGAYAPNGQNNADFFSDIKGYSDVHPEDEKAKPTADKMSGLQKVNDYEFKVTLSSPNITFKQKLGYTAFYPMPDSFFKAPDKNKWAKDKPIGNGPYSFVEYKPSVETKLKRFDQFSGPDKPQPKEIDFKVYQNQDAAYRDLQAGNLDFMEVVPPSALAGNKYKTDLDGRVLNGPLMTDEAIAIPEYLKEPAFKNPDFRHGISMAINRAEISKQIFNGSREPIDGWLPTSVPGVQKGACGEFCQYNPQKAKELIQKVGFKGTIPILSNADAGHKEWIEAVANSINKTLEGTGVKAQFSPVPTFQVLRQQEAGKQLAGWTRSGWNFDFPSPDSQLAALYKTGGSTNITDYSNPKFDQLLEQAREAATDDEANKDYAEAEKMLAADMPQIPLWSETGTAAYSDKIKSVKENKMKRVADVTSIVLNNNKS
ncbi:peptide ABC transporter substrate-binding protein [Sciscionella sediminilitoris]|uniref:peptide ABC transporter substrate-binding protein n=1 Tax=Sciscionella sediminilitoris TaxID=1445613 RepID=UPI0004DF7F32|nr:ABC transporter substrate-binding protein [Sciscionella sp. SE31]